MARKMNSSLVLESCIPSLEAALQKEPLDRSKFPRVVLPVQNPDARPLSLAHFERRRVVITDGSQTCAWQVESLNSLFRGDRKPPVMGGYPPKEYELTFLLLEFHALELSRFVGDRRDEEMLEIYSTLRRRPDGKSLGVHHDYIWQAAALVLGTQTLSRAEFEAVLARLERSCRTFRMGPTSKNYIGSLRRALDGVD